MTAIGLIALIGWLALMAARHGFWRADRRLEATRTDETDTDAPGVVIAIPARNEADVIDLALNAHAAQRYPGVKAVVVADDQSDDDTRARAEAAGARMSAPFEIVAPGERPEGWTGKIWALNAALDAARAKSPDADYALLCDADIALDPGMLRALVAKAEAESRDMVSIMALLRADSPWEHVLVPAFVYFFQKLYPFPAVNDRARRTAAAAGGCVLIRLSALDAVGGLSVIRDALIDDCALARAVKRRSGGPPYQRIWLGLSQSVRSLRGYDGLGGVWRMVARSAFDQLDYSIPKLAGTLVGLGVLYFGPPLAVINGLSGGGFGPLLFGAAAYAVMMRTYWPTLELYDRPKWEAAALPIAAGLYMGMTVDSALKHAQGRGGEWKGRADGGKQTDPAPAGTTD